MVYADNAATTRLDKDAYESMVPFLTEEYGNPSQPYSFSRPAKEALSKARETISSCIGADRDEIFFTSGGTESDNWALKGYVKKQKKRGLVISSIEHHAILHTASSLARDGYKIIEIDTSEAGVIRPSALQKEMTEDVSLVSVMMANNEIGSIQPVGKLARITHEHGAVFHTDAVQAIGHVEIDVKKLGVDMLSASAHKFNGPRGIGFLYVRKGIELYPFMDGGSQERGMRAGTENVAAIVGMSVALKKNCEMISEERRRLLRLEEVLISGLTQRGMEFRRNGSRDHLPGNVSLSFKDADGEMLLHRLDLKGICVSTGSACNGKDTHVSHVIRAINVPDEYAGGTIRISLGRDNTEDDVACIINGIAEILG